MLKRIHIQNYRSCEDVTIEDLGAMTALVGLNASGKSNILRAIEWFARSTSRGVEETEHFGILHSGKPRRVSAEMILKKISYKYEFVFQRELSGSKSQISPVRLVESLSVVDRETKQEIFHRRGTEVQSPHSEPISISEHASTLPTLVSLLPSSSSLVKKIRPLIEYLKKIRYYTLEEHSTSDESRQSTSSFIPESDYHEWLENYQRTEDAGSSVLMRLLHLHLTDDERLRVLRDVLGPNGLDLLHRIEVTRYAIPAGVHPEAGNGRKLVVYACHFFPNLHTDWKNEESVFEYSDLSVGTRRILRILISFIFDKNSVMLLEHPEDAIHAELARKLILQIKRMADPSQIILATHSATILNALQPADIRLVSMRNGRTKVEPLNGRQIKAATKFITQAGGALADFLEPLQGE